MYVVFWTSSSNVMYVWSRFFSIDFKIIHYFSDLLFLFIFCMFVYLYPMSLFWSLISFRAMWLSRLLGSCHWLIMIAHATPHFLVMVSFLDMVTSWRMRRNAPTESSNFLVAWMPSPSGSEFALSNICICVLPALPSLTARTPGSYW